MRALALVRFASAVQPAVVSALGVRSTCGPGGRGPSSPAAGAGGSLPQQRLLPAAMLLLARRLLLECYYSSSAAVLQCCSAAVVLPCATGTNRTVPQASAGRVMAESRQTNSTVR
jgi:hypothetical protein